MWKRGDDVAYLVSAFGSPLTSHIDLAARIRFRFGEVKWVLKISHLLQVFSPVAPVDVVPGNDLQAEFTYDNHPSS